MGGCIRAARFCLAAAHGGQIVAPIETVEKIIADWTQQPCPPMLENNRPIVAVKASLTSACGVWHPLVMRVYLAGLTGSAQLADVPEEVLVVAHAVHCRRMRQAVRPATWRSRPSCHHS